MVFACGGNRTNQTFLPILLNKELLSSVLLEVTLCTSDTSH